MSNKTPDTHLQKKRESSRFSRRNMLLRGSSLVAAAGLPSVSITTVQAQQQAQQQAPSTSRPNIILVLMDNLGYGELGVYGGGILRGAPTPRIDKLSAEGTRLLNFNVEAQCTPSRAALLTGRHAIRTGNATVPIETPVYGLVQWEYTMAKMLSDVGYASGACRDFQREVAELENDVQGP
jgi:Sulfatase